MAAGALTKIGIPTLRRHHQRFHSLLKASSNQHAVPSPKIAGDRFPHRFQCERRLQFPKSISAKTKPLDVFSRSLRAIIPPPATGLGSSPPKLGLMGWYLGMIKSQPILTKSITATLIYIVADLSSQSIAIGEERGWDWARTFRMGAYGMMIIGPSLHYWFNFASRLFPNRDVLSTIKKIAIGQILLGPTATAIFFSGNAALQGESGSEIVARLKRDLIPTLIKGIMYWPPCDFVTFKFIPLHLQPLVSNSFSYLWTVYLTYMASLTKVNVSAGTG
ncbi:uncharacterized protein LOC127252381 [Andrographis paniculata]|uniref:uncharacterized protein LOC127252381 n=1 Tax=Andrographis paniculata TaxID=175694 RepID=UPI0021E7C347|nr:uncharacterized protein LOC127252381 [Andrographis paniculata]